MEQTAPLVGGPVAGMSVLIIDGDPRVAAALRTVLTLHGFATLEARTACDGMRRLADRPEMVLLGPGLPERDGLQLCAEIRRRSSVPVIMVTARSDPAAPVQALDLGADDYLVKPYRTAELLARIHAVARRAYPWVDERQHADGVDLAGRRVGPLAVDPATRTVRVDGRPVGLTRKEFDLLLLLARHPGVVYRREHILAEVWNTSWAGSARTLEVHVASLRRKLGRPDLVQTVRGIGYRLHVGRP